MDVFRSMAVKSLLIYFLILSCTAFSAYSRAGGGGGGAGTYGRGLGVIIGLVNLILILWFVYRKNKKAKQLIAFSGVLDSVWNYDEMIAYSQEVFVRMQNAWKERDMDLVKDLVTDRLYHDYQKQLDWQKVKHEQNVIESIDIRRAQIIGVEDHSGKDEDKFTVYIKGKLVDYTISDKTGKIYENKSKSKTRFVDLYYFIRNGDKWLLDKIDNDVSLGKILKTKEIVD
jgi:hypothetical protein